MSVSSIADTVLNKTSLIAKNERIEGASIFPFFCKSGQVRQLMIILPETKSIFMIPFKKGLATASLFGVVKLSMDLAEIKSHTHFSPSQIDHLYHYDPHWFLSQERFSAYWAKHRIKASNCAGYLARNIRHILFSRDLSSIKQIVMTSGYLNLFRSITLEKLLASIPPRQSGKATQSSAPATSGWQLDPLWNNWREF